MPGRLARPNRPHPSLYDPSPRPHPLPVPIHYSTPATPIPPGQTLLVSPRRACPCLPWPTHQFATPRVYPISTLQATPNQVCPFPIDSPHLADLPTQTRSNHICPDNPTLQPSSCHFFSLRLPSTILVPPPLVKAGRLTPSAPPNPLPADLPHPAVSDQFTSYRLTSPGPIISLLHNSTSYTKLKSKGESIHGKHIQLY